MLDLAQETGLGAIVFDERLLRLTVQAKRRIVGELFGTKKEFFKFVAQCLSDYCSHPAFRGVSVVDEPMVGAAGVIKDICAAVHAAQPHAFVHTCFLPFIQDRGRIEGAFGKGYKDCWAAYRNYIRKMAESGIGYYGFDAYPFGMWEGKTTRARGMCAICRKLRLRRRGAAFPFT